jgi:hypothetical protein
MIKIGDVFKTNNYGLAEIIEILPKSSAKIKFKNTGYEKTVFLHHLRCGKCKDNSVSNRKLEGKKAENRFCVYLHKDQSGKVLYVGEGTISRAYTKSRLDQPTWMSVFGEQPPVVEIIAKDLTKNEAEELEELVRTYYEGTIINANHATKRVKDIQFEHISKYVYYDESSPTFIRWVKRENNSARANSPAGYFPKDKRKYAAVEIEGKVYSIHRLVWVLHNTELSTDHMIDHIDGNRLNNSISNLRIADAKSNSHNRIVSIPKSGYRNIREEFSNNKITSYTVRWNPLDHSDRQWRTFTVSKYGSLKDALKAAYDFRDTLIEQGFLSSRIKEGEVSIE